MSFFRKLFESDNKSSEIDEFDIMKQHIIDSNKRRK